MSGNDERETRGQGQATAPITAVVGPVRLETEWTLWAAPRGPFRRFWTVRGCVAGRPVLRAHLHEDAGRGLQASGFFDDELRLVLTADFERGTSDGQVRIEVDAAPTTARQERILDEGVDASPGSLRLGVLPTGERTLALGCGWWSVSPDLLGPTEATPPPHRIQAARQAAVDQIARWIVGAAASRSSTPPLGTGFGPDRVVHALGAHRLRVEPGHALLEEGLDGLQRAFSVAVDGRWLVDGHMRDTAFWRCVEEGVFEGPVELLLSIRHDGAPRDGLLHLDLHLVAPDAATQAILDDLVREHGPGVPHHRLSEGDVALSLGRRVLAAGRGEPVLGTLLAPAEVA